MKKLLSSLAALLLAVVLVVPVPASETASIHPVDASSVTASEVRLMSRDETPWGHVDAYSVSLPDDGAYHALPDFRGLYPAGSLVTVHGTWGPTCARVQVLLRESDHHTSVYSYAACSAPTVFGLWSTSLWDCFLKADGQPLSGTLRIEVTTPA